MNKRAFVALIAELKHWFSADKIAAYENQVINLENDPEYKAEKEQRRRWMEEEKQGQNAYVVYDRDQTANEKKNHIVHALNWLKPMISQLDSDDLDKNIEIIRNHFKAVYEEAYNHRLDGQTDREKALKENEDLYFFLQPGVLGGPEFDDMVIFNYLTSIEGAVAEINGVFIKDSLSHDNLASNLKKCKFKMMIQDPGLQYSSLSPTYNEFTAKHDKELKYVAEILYGLGDFKEEEYGEEEKKSEIFKLIHDGKQVSPTSPVTPSDADPVDEERETFQKFYTEKKDYRKKHFPEMSELLKEINRQENVIAASGNLPASSFEKLSEQVAMIRTKYASVKPKDFHSTEMFLQSVEAYSEKMSYLRNVQTERENSKEESEFAINRRIAERTVIRTRNVIDDLAERMNKAASGRQSQEFARLYKAFDVLSSKTACDTRELEEQLFEAKRAADDYIKAKDRLRITGSRSTEKGQARYDAAKRLSSMADVFMKQLAQINDKECMPILQDFATGYQKGDKKYGQFEPSKDRLYDFLLSPAVYFHRANRWLSQIQEAYELEPAHYKLLGKSGRLVRYLNNMDLAENRNLRTKVTCTQAQFFEQDRVGSTPLLLTDDAKAVYRYMLVFAYNGDRKVIKDGMEYSDEADGENCFVTAGFVEDMRNAVYEYRKKLDNIKIYDRKQTKSLMLNNEAKDEMVQEFLDDIHYNIKEQKLNGFREQALEDLNKALEQHYRELEQKQQISDKKQKETSKNKESADLKSRMNL